MKRLDGTNTVSTKFVAPEGMTHNERTRRRIVNLVFMVYWLLIFEGVLRKWVWPQYSQYLFFIRDPFVLSIYIIALINGKWPRAKPALIFAYVISLWAIIWIAIQLLTGSTDGTRMLLAAYGWRNYFLYIPLAFLIAEQFREDDLYRLFRQTLIIAIPISILVIAQFAAPTDSILNSGIATEESLQFKGMRGALGHNRPNATFTSTVGQNHFVVTSISMLFIMWILPSRQRPIPTLLLAISTVAAAVCLAFSISRGMFIHAGIVTLSTLIAGAALRGRMSLRALFLPLGLTLVATVLFPIVFPDAFSAFVARWSEGATHEGKYFGSLGVFGRALYEFIDFFRLFDTTPFFGYGMGLAGNASTVLDQTVNGMLPISLAESDWSRHFVDMGPLLAMLFIVFRITFVLQLGIQALASTRQSRHPMPVLLFGYVGIVLLYGQITGHGSISGYVWLFTGFLMAAIQTKQPYKEMAPVKTGPPDKHRDKGLTRSASARILHKRADKMR